MIRWYNTTGVKERGNFPSDRLFYLRFTFFSFTSRSLPRLELRISVNYIEYLACWEQEKSRKTSNTKTDGKGQGIQFYELKRNLVRLRVR